MRARSHPPLSQVVGVTIGCAVFWALCAWALFG